MIWSRTETAADGAGPETDGFELVRGELIAMPPPLNDGSLEPFLRFVHVIHDDNLEPIAVSASMQKRKQPNHGPPIVILQFDFFELFTRWIMSLRRLI